MPLIKPPWATITLHGFIDFLRRYWMHIAIVLFIYNAKDFLDEIDRLLMANTGLDMTPWIYAIEGDMVLWVQQTFQAQWLTIFLTHFYVVGFMVICYVSIFYFAYFDDRWLADRISLTIFWVYILAIPFYLFFNVRVTGDHIPEMEALAYNLTPEINDWFTRIDPFTNGMPSLHIGFPFAVWLCLLRHDADNRWIVYRRLVFGYFILTAFCILYLGIHWFLDIVGGMAVAAMAVNLSDRTSGPIWRILDERTINARLATVLTNPKRAWNIISSQAKDMLNRYSRPSSNETGVMITVVIILVAGIITWDLTHQTLPAGGVEAPVEVTAADGWLVTLDDRETGALVLVHDLSDLELEIAVAQPIMDANSSYDVSGNHLVMSNSTILYVIDILDPGTIILQKEVYQLNNVVMLPGGIFALFDAEGLSYWGLDGLEVSGPNAPEGDEIELFESSGDEIAMVFASNPNEVNIGMMGAEGLISIQLNVTAPELEDLVLEEQWGLVVDEENASIVDLSFNRDYLAATVNVTATTRLVLLDRSTGDSFLASDPKYPTFDPDIGYGVLVWASQQHLNPTNPQEKYLDKEILLLDLETNHTEVLTADEEDQWGPMALENHIVYRQEDADGVRSVEIHQREATLKPYASSTLQIGVIIAISLLLIHLMQRQMETKDKNQPP